MSTTQSPTATSTLTVTPTLVPTVPSDVTAQSVEQLQAALADRYGATSANERPPRSRARWPIFGLVAAVTGFLSSALTFPSETTREEQRSGVAVISKLERGHYHAAFILGLVSIGALLVTAAGWRRWAEARAPRDLAARTIGHGFAVVATVNVVFTALLGTMALYLPGGMDHGTIGPDQMFVNWSLLDFGNLLGWWGAVVAAICVATISLRRNRILPRWMGVVSVLFALPPIAYAVATGLPGFPGLTMPVWLAVMSIGMIASRRAEA